MFKYSAMFALSNEFGVGENMVSKGQGSAEYLIVLAAVLIVALVAVMLLGAFPSFGGDARATESNNYWRGTARPFSIPEHSQTNSTIFLSVSNMETDRIVLLGITLIGFNATNYPNGVSFGSGTTKTLNVTGLPACDPTNYDSYEYDVRISYNISGIIKTQTASKPLVGKCLS